MCSYTLGSELVGLIVPFPISGWESDIPSLFNREVRLNPPKFLEFVYMSRYIAPIVRVLVSGIDGGAFL